MAEFRITAKNNKNVLTLTDKELNYLYRLLGNHILGTGQYRDLNYHIFSAIDDVVLDESHDTCSALPLVGEGSGIILK